MKVSTKVASQPTKPAPTKKPSAARPDGKPKVKQGTGRNVLFMSDTLFDDDLKG